MKLDYALAVGLHQLATVVWIGGMFFAHFALRGSAQAKLEPDQRMPLMLAVFDRFFVWVWLSILTLWGSGFWMFFSPAGGKWGWYVHAMMSIAALMTLLFAFLYFKPYPALRRHVTAQDWPGGAKPLGLIRHIILVNLGLGLLNAALGGAGRYLL